MVFFIVGCAKRRSTRTIMVLSCLSLTTTPWSVRFGISNPLFLRLCLGARLRLRSGLWFSGLRLLLGLFSLRRGRSLCDRLRHSGALLRRDRLHARDVAPDYTNPRRVLELTSRPLKAQIELLFLQLEHFIIELIERHRSYIGGFHRHHSAIRSIKRVLTGSLAAASPSASRATETGMPSTSKRIRPGF